MRGSRKAKDIDDQSKGYGGRTIAAEAAQQDRPEPKSFKPSQDEIERRQYMAYVWRQQIPALTYDEIVVRFREQDPPIRVGRNTVQIYISDYYARVGKLVGQKRDAVARVVRMLDRYDLIEAQALNVIGSSSKIIGGPTTIEKLAAMRVIVDVLEARTVLLQRLGLLEKAARQFKFNEEGETVVEKTPTGIDLRDYFKNVEVLDAEIVSDAEKAIRYGEHSAVAGRRTLAEHSDPIEPVERGRS